MGIEPGYYSTPGKVIRSGWPTPGGCLLSILGELLSAETAVVMLASR
jgi:hypothetical protein